MSSDLNTVKNLLDDFKKNNNNCKYSVKKIDGRTGNKYDIIGIKLKKSMKYPSIIMCSCLGYKYHKKCWHSTKLNKTNKCWLDKKLKWKNI